MLVDSELPTPFLPITSPQAQYFQAVAHSFARRRSAIPPVFNDFPTLSVATGVVPLSCQSFGAITAAGSCSPLFRLTRFGLERFSHNPTFRSFRADHRAIAPRFSGEKQLRMQNPATPALPIQCCISPFNARKHRSEKGLEPYRQLR